MLKFSESPTTVIVPKPRSPAIDLNILKRLILVSHRIILNLCGP